MVFFFLVVLVLLVLTFPEHVFLVFLLGIPPLFHRLPPPKVSSAALNRAFCRRRVSPLMLASLPSSEGPLKSVTPMSESFRFPCRLSAMEFPPPSPPPVFTQFRAFSSHSQRVFHRLWHRPGWVSAYKKRYVSSDFRFLNSSRTEKFGFFARLPLIFPFLRAGTFPPF